jgi:hypothetical protein
VRAKKEYFCNARPSLACKLAPLTGQPVEKEGGGEEFVLPTGGFRQVEEGGLKRRGLCRRGWPDQGMDLDDGYGDTAS